MDIQKEEKFEALPEIEMMLRENPDIKFENGGYVYHGLNQLTALAVCYVAGAWMAWKEAKAQAVPEWISVENELPKKNIKVLLNIVARRRGKPFSCIGFYSVEPDDEPCFILDDNFTILKGVTHWMQLPQAPKAQESAND